jgi:ribosomal protein L44E
MYLEKIPEVLIKRYDEFVCAHCGERVDKKKAKFLGWTHYPEADFIETYCPVCTKEWDHYVQDAVEDGRNL